MVDAFPQQDVGDLARNALEVPYKDLIASGSRSPRPGALHTFVTTETFR